VKLAGYWFDRMNRVNPARLANATVFAIDLPHKRLHVETSTSVQHITFDKLLLATGARELFIPFPGWTLPNVLGCGGLQAMAKQGWPIKGKRIVVAGSGPLVLAAAAQFKHEGAKVVAIAEQAPMSSMVSFMASLPTIAPSKIFQGMALRTQVLGSGFRTSTWVAAAQGTDRLESVTLTNGKSSWQEKVDYLACAYGLIPSLELPTMLGCTIQNGAVTTDVNQQTSAGGIYCAGEPLGIGGADCALVEGQIAGYAAAGAPQKAATLHGAARKSSRFRALLAQAFTLRPELKSLAQADTIVCRCEDVTRARLDACGDWRSAKLHTRCGMGPCQGRICGGATSVLYGWQHYSVRPPVLPVRVDALAHMDENQPPAPVPAEAH
jgi:NADPH-dependent 2,4-dienoyl-CoA reductase/sulfur reductase-like enzyme